MPVVTERHEAQRKVSQGLTILRGIGIVRINTELLSLDQTLHDAARSICENLATELDAIAVRLWLHNPTFYELNLLGQHCADGFEQPFSVESNCLPLRTSIAGMALLERSVIRRQGAIGSLLNLDGTNEPGREQLNALPCALLCIPICPMRKGGREPIGTLNLFLPCGSEDEARTLAGTDDELVFVASLVAATLARADELGRAQTLVELNRIASKLVAPNSDRSFSQRKQTYFENLLKTILAALNANAMSIFTANETVDTIRCCATTGIVGEPNLDKVVYHAGEGITHLVFESGKSINSQNVRSLDGYRGRYAETRRIPPTTKRDPFLAVPLSGESHSTGVIRVLERRCHVNPELLQNFSPYDVAMLDAVAQQVSPVLRLLALHEARDLYVMRMAHQVMQPLAGMIAYTSNMLDGDYGFMGAVLEQKVRFVRAMARASARVVRSSEWVTELKDFRFLGSHPRSRLPLAQYLVERVIDMQPIRREEGIKVHLVDDVQVDRLGDFLVDDLYFEQVVQNVLHNAVKYSYPQTTVEVRASRLGNDLSITVASSGIPILPAESDRIFWDRERGHHAQGYDPNGTGQGLYISRQIMAGFGGSLELVSSELLANVRPPKGLPPPYLSKFRIFLPRAFR
jgi:signal transduction histidine kinase